ncbi:MAG TPA: ABC transporter substrate-binding protein [Acidimicrobiales bacterium]|nr:ABC transporter substrate-binding protein [Acidimicrobiales bacterium]
MLKRPVGNLIRRRPWSVLVGLSALVTTIATCGLGSASASSASGLGAPNPARGTPVSVGIITDAGSGTVSTGALVEAGARMGVSWANQYAKGLGGHPIKLVVCENQETPAGGQVCANQMVQDKVVAVVLPFTGEGAVEVPTITQAGIPYVTISGASSQELTTTGSFALTGGFPADLGAIALQAKQKGLKKVAMLVSDVPAAITGAQTLGGLVFKSAGVGFKVIPVEPGTADMTPQLQSAVSWGAAAVGITGDLTLCTSFLKGYQTLSLKLPKYLVGPCVAPSVVQSLGSVLKGSYTAGTSLTGTKDAATYAAMTKKYAPSVSPNPNVSANQLSGTESVWALVSLMTGYTGDVSASTIQSQLESRKNVPLPLSGGLTFTCNGTAIPLLKSVCSATTYLGVLTAKGQIASAQKFNSSALFKS